MNIKTIIADHHPVVRLSLRTVLNEGGYKIVGEADTAEAVLNLCSTLRPGLLLLDVAQPELDGLHLIRQLKLRELPTKILVFTGQVSNAITDRCMAEGAHGLVYKHEDPSRLIDSIRTIATGYTYFPSRRPAPAHQEFDTQRDEKLLSALSLRELCVLQRLSWGQTQKSIAQTLCLSNKTISTYKARLLFKLNANTSVELYEIARRNGLS
ncbi:response regulator [Pseudomonas sp. SDO524_S393]